MLNAVAMRTGTATLRVAGLPLLLMPPLVLTFSMIQPNFASLANVSNVAVQASHLAIFALAQTYVMVVRGFDLSIGTTTSLISVASGMAMVHALGLGASPALAIAAGVAAGIMIGLAVGAVNGFFIAALRLSPFVVTLATLNICLGLASSISQGFQIFNLPDAFNRQFNQARPLNIPVPILVAAVLLAASFVLFRYTRLGRAFYFIGTNPRAAAVAGLPVKRYGLTAYLICSVLAACGALLLTARTGSGEPNLGGSLMLESVAAAVIGGTSLRGGRGGALSPIVGALFITVLSNGMNLSRIDGYIQQMILGLVIVLTAFGESNRDNARV